MRLWDPERGVELHSLAGHTGPVEALSGGQLGDRPVLASGGEDRTVRLWDPMIERLEDRLPRLSL